ncbi:MAG: hypothetical protein ACE5EQ_01060 [Phycisphaerae bacterium]
MNSHIYLILAASDHFSLVILAIAAVSVLGKLLGKKKEENAEDQSARDEEIVEIDLGDLLGMHESAPPPMARPTQSSVPPPIPNRKRSRHQAPATPVPELRIARRSRKKSRSATKPKQAKQKSSPRKSRVRVSDPSADETEIWQPPNRSLLRELLTSHPASLRGSLLIAELLAPPVALRDPSAPSMGPPGSAV